MTARLTAMFVTVCLCWPAVLAGAKARGALHGLAEQARELTRSQRELLLALIVAADREAASGADASWQIHRMRAVDGSHYVAFSARPLAPLPRGPVVLYVRLATTPSPESVRRVAERSLLRAWLAGDPKAAPPTRNTILMGNMPALGAAGALSRRPPTTPGMNDLQAIELDQRRAREREEERERRHRAALEGKTVITPEVMPFEDFDFSSRSVNADGARIITRAFTTGPGDYDLVLAWADPAAPKPVETIRVVRRPLQLPPAPAAELSISSIILVDRIDQRAAPSPPSAQAANPYTFGVTEIVPAADSSYTRDDRLSAAFQIINPRPAENGKPDLAVSFRIVRVAAGRDTPVASITPQVYDASTLPPDFDLRLGHPVVAAVSASLATLGRGEYRFEIMTEDRVSGGRAAAGADFRVVPTPASLLAEAPPLGPAFSRETALDTETLAEVVDGLAPAAASPALGRALSTARNGKLVDLLIEEPVLPQERGVRTALTGLALLSLGNASAAVEFQRALQQQPAAGPLQFLIGVAWAAQSRDPDAIVAWQLAMASGHAPRVTLHLLADAYLRRGEHQHAIETLTAMAGEKGPAALRTWAAAQIAAGRPGEAVAALDAVLARDGADPRARWLLLHALYADFVGGNRARLARTASELQRYIEANGEHAALAAEWAKVISSAPL